MIVSLHIFHYFLTMCLQAVNMINAIAKITTVNVRHSTNYLLHSMRKKKALGKSVQVLWLLFCC